MKIEALNEIKAKAKPVEAADVAGELQKIADVVSAKKAGWKITTSDPEGKRQGEPRIIFSEKSHRAKIAYEDGQYTFSFEQKARGWGAMWHTVAKSKTAQGLIDEINKNLN